MSLHKSMEALKFDNRMLEINLRSGAITQAEYDAYLKSLPDIKELSEPLKIETEQPISEH